jgi:hypothetical protein
MRRRDKLLEPSGTPLAGVMPLCSHALCIMHHHPTAVKEHKKACIFWQYERQPHLYLPHVAEHSVLVSPGALASVIYQNLNGRLCCLTERTRVWSSPS